MKLVLVALSTKHRGESTVVDNVKNKINTHVVRLRTIHRHDAISSQKRTNKLQYQLIDNINFDLI